MITRLLVFLEARLAVLLYVLQRFRTGWMIELVRRQDRDGNWELALVRWRVQKILRGIRYVRGNEGMPEPVCDECNHTVQEHELLCPEVEETECSEDSDGNDGPSSSCGKEPSSAVSSTE